MSTRKLTDILTGLKGGAFATLVMTVYRAPISQSPPPPAWLWAEYVAGGDPEDHLIPSLVLHFIYGIVGGGVFGVLVGPHLNGPEVNRERYGSVLGIVYGLLLSGFGALVLLDWLLGMDLDDDERYIFRMGHLIYGVSLGAWFGSREEE